MLAQSLVAIQAELPLLLLDQEEDKRRLCSQSVSVELSAWKCVIPLNPFTAKFGQKQILIKCPNFIL